MVLVIIMTHSLKPNLVRAALRSVNWNLFILMETSYCQWLNDLESLNNFVVNVLKLQGKWLTPGGNTKQFKSSNGNVTTNWYNKKQQTLNFQGRDGPALMDTLVELVRKKPGTSVDLQGPELLVSTEQTI